MHCRHNIAVLGPHGNATRHLIQHNVGRVCPPSDASNTKKDEYRNDFHCVETPAEAIARYNVGAKTTFLPGEVLVVLAMALGMVPVVALVNKGRGGGGGWYQCWRQHCRSPDRLIRLLIDGLSVAIRTNPNYLLGDRLTD